MKKSNGFMLMQQQSKSIEDVFGNCLSMLPFVNNGKNPLLWRIKKSYKCVWSPILKSHPFKIHNIGSIPFHPVVKPIWKDLVSKSIGDKVFITTDTKSFYDHFVQWQFSNLKAEK